MKILHVVPGLNEPTNGIAVAAKWIVAEQVKSGAEVEVVETRDFISPSFVSDVRQFDEIWVHSMWLPMTLKSCWKALKAGVPLVRMPHGCLDPVKVRYHLWKKIFFIPVERWLMRHAERIIATEEAEAGWIKRFVRCGALGTTRPTVEMLELGSAVKFMPRPGLGKNKFLFVGRMHPLKGVDILIEAIRSLKEVGRQPADFVLTIIGKDEKGMRSRFEVESHGLPVRFLGEVEESVKRAEMSAADCLVLPTLSENFGLVVKESLECGVPVITTDGAMYWKGKAGVCYLDGFVAADVARRVQMLASAIGDVIR